MQGEEEGAKDISNVKFVDPFRVYEMRTHTSKGAPRATMTGVPNAAAAIVAKAVSINRSAEISLVSTISRSNSH